MAEMEQEQPATAEEPTVAEQDLQTEPVSEIMKTKHDTVKNSISNIR